MEFKMAEEVKIGQKFKDFLAKEGKVNDDGTLTELNLGSLRAFYKAEGVTEDLVKKCSEVQKEVDTGKLLYGTDKLAELIEAGKKDKMSKDELKALKHEIRITVPLGTNYSTITAAKDYSNPTNRDETVTHYAALKDRTKLSKSIDKDAVAFCEEKIAKLLDF
jgi:hypothetical protein